MDAARLSGTEPVPPGGAFDLDRLDRFLKANLPDAAGALDAARFRGGQSNPTYLLSLDGRPRFVLRKKPDGPLLPSAHAIEREFRVMAALGGTGVPVPGVHVLCDDASIVGAPFFVMDHVAGRSFWNAALPEVPAPDRAAIHAAAGRTIAALHRIDPDRAGLAGFGRPDGYVARQVARWTGQYRASETGRIEAMERLIAWLPEHVPPQAGVAPIHGDYRIDNLIFHPSEPRVVAVIDWELSTLGDPLADFAAHTLAWRLPTEPFRGLAGLDLAALGIPDERAYRDAYLAAVGRPAVEDRHWYAYLAFGLFRIAAIRQGIVRRVLDGTAASAFAREAGALAGAVAELGWAMAERADRS